MNFQPISASPAEMAVKHLIEHLAGMEKSFQIFHKKGFSAKMRYKINKLTEKKLI